MNKKFVSRLIRDIVPSSVPLVSLPEKTLRNGRLYSVFLSFLSSPPTSGDPGSQTLKPPSKRTLDSRFRGNDASPLSSPPTSFLSSPPTSGDPEFQTFIPSRVAVPRVTTSKGFTLLEVMVVTTILATLATTTLVTLNPTELLAQMRDSQRITTIGMLRDAISLLVADAPATNLGDITLVHISLPSNNPNCTDIVGLPTLPSGMFYRCVTAANLTRIDGHGWIPLNFNNIVGGAPFTVLPTDIINTPALFYSYIPSPGGRATLTARIESIRQRTLHPTEIFTTHFTSAVDRPPLGTGQVTVPLGSIASPSYSFVGDLNTGIFSPLADSIGFSTFGTERMRIDNMGFVGIGTTTPGQRLTVAGVIHSTTGGFMFPDGTIQTRAGGAPLPGTNAFIGGITVSSLATPETPTVAPQGTAGTTTYSYRITARSLVGETLASPAGTTTTGNVTLSATNFVRITWTAVSGAVDYRIYRTTSGGTPATTGLIGTTTALTFNDTGLAASGAVPTVDNSGNVGIGTTGPTTRLDIEGQIRIRGGAPAAGRVLTADATGLATWATPAGGLPTGTASQTLRHDGTIWVANSNIFNTGTNVGIGTTNPTTNLHVVGTGTFSGPVSVATPTAGTHAATRDFVLASVQATGGGLVWRRVFVTSTTHDGNLGGVPGADSICMARATAAALPGTWRAIISSFAVDGVPSREARQRVGYRWDVLTNMAGGIVAVWPRAAATPITSMSDLWDGAITAPIQYDELGNRRSGAVWTGTTAMGTLHTTHTNCSSWASSDSSAGGGFGHANHTGPSWIDPGASGMGCHNLLRLYCIEQ